MSYQVLSRKWRPKKFEDVIGQEHITTSLVNALKRGRAGHAYLFTGTRGVGKTSVARIFAKSIRCVETIDGQACEKCESCVNFNDTQSLDVIEIDGASNNSVDNIRELINNVQFLPSTGKYRVYIIDEVHMLSTSAFNALLKTLEEPPAHVIFIFATTEPDKILDTVLSRCQRFDFRSPSKEKVSKLLNEIAEKESIKFENQNIVDKISFFGNGSVRDSLSILDQLLTFSEDNNINENTLFLGLGLAKQTSLYNLSKAVLEGDIISMTEVYRNLQNENVSSEKIYHGLIDTFYELINSLMGGETQYAYSLDSYGPQELMWVYETLSKDMDWAFKSFDLGKTLEVILQKICARRESLTDGTVHQKKKITPKAVVKKEIVTETPKSKPAPAVETKVEVKPEPKIEIKVEVKPEVSPEPVATPEKSEAIEVKEVQLEKEIIEKVIVEKIDETPSWKGFLKHLYAISAAKGSNLEQGNIISEPKMLGEGVTVKLGFPKSAKVFYEYLSQLDVRVEIEKELAAYYKVNVEKVDLELDLKGQEETFHSVANLKDIKLEEDIKEAEEQIRNDPSIKMAEELFNSKVDKIIIDKKRT